MKNIIFILLILTLSSCMEENSSAGDVSVSERSSSIKLLNDCNCVLPEIKGRYNRSDEIRDIKSGGAKGGIDIKADVRKILDLNTSLGGGYSDQRVSIRKVYNELSGDVKLSHELETYRLVTCAIYELICSDTEKPARQRMNEIEDLLLEYKKDVYMVFDRNDSISINEPSKNADDRGAYGRRFNQLFDGDNTMFLNLGNELSYHSLLFSNDGNQLLIKCSGKVGLNDKIHPGYISRYDIETKELIGKSDYIGYGAFDMVYTKNNSEIITSDGNELFKLDVKSGNVIQKTKLDNPLNGFMRKQLKISRDGRFGIIAELSSGNDFYIFSIDNLKVIATREKFNVGRTRYVGSVDFDLSNNIILSGLTGFLRKGRLQIYDLESGLMKNEYVRNYYGQSYFPINTEIFITGNKKELSLINSANMRVEKTCKPDVGTWIDFLFTNILSIGEKKIIGWGFNSKHVIIWDIIDGQIEKIIDHGAVVSDIAIHPSKSFIATLGGNEIKFWVI